MKFYTNVQVIGNDFLIRGYEDGKACVLQGEVSTHTCL